MTRHLDVIKTAQAGPNKSRVYRRAADIEVGFNCVYREGRRRVEISFERAVNARYETATELITFDGKG